MLKDLLEKTIKNTYTQKAKDIVTNSLSKTYLKFNILLKKSMNSSDIVLWIDPAEIKYMADNNSATRERFLFTTGKIVDEKNWDIKFRKIEEYDFFTSSAEHYEEGIPWNQTDFYARRINEMKAGIEKSGSKNIKEWHLRLQEEEEHYNRIKKHGYKSQAELKTHRFWDEVRVCIGRKGELYFVDGRHRLSIAKALEIDKIPVVITHIHKEYYLKEYSL